MSTSPDEVRLPCLHCKTWTRHKTVSKYNQTGENEDIGETWWDEYRVLECQGCDTVTFQHTSRSTFDLDEHGSPAATIRYYPSRTTRTPIEQAYCLPDQLKNVYKETLVALSNDAPILAAAGIRSVVEAVCQDKTASADNLERSIDTLVEKGFLSEEQADFLHLQRYLGNIAVHEIKAPEEQELEAALDIVENLLRTLYVLPRLAARMRRSQEELKKRQKAKTVPNPPRIN